jgi:type I restriction-modification system DNA methylase subunit
LKQAGEDMRLDQAAVDTAHQILLRWADQEKSGRLGKLHETQLQGDFLNEVFGQALGYSRPVEGAAIWHLEQHHATGGGTPDAVLGQFAQDKPPSLRAVIELKGPRTHLDRDRSNGRTAVDQCWDYLVNTPKECRWGIVSNIVSFRLYERDSTKRVYEHFTLQSLRDPKVFRQFYALFRRKSLIEPTQPPRLADLLAKTLDRQREVGDELYQAYSSNRTDLIADLHFKRDLPLDTAIEMAQRLFDRIIFIAFCEDRGLLPEQSLATAFAAGTGFLRITNPKWQSFKALFHFVNVGSDAVEVDRHREPIPAYNGGLFAPHAVDGLELPDEPWTNFFNSIGTYDFADEVNLDVLGHLFERSITELEKLKTHGIYGDAEKAQRYASMPQSAKRKQLGTYYTPSELTSLIVEYTVAELIDERFAELAVKFGVAKSDAQRRFYPPAEAFWRGCLDILRNLKVVDPACGSGAFLFQAYTALEQRYHEVVGHLEHLETDDADELTRQIPHFILNENLYGVDLSAEAVEITQLALWIRSATRGQTLATLSRNIFQGNSLVHDPASDAGFDWRERFPQVFDRDESGFDCVVGNPPWERIKLQEREFFSLPAPEIATATNAAKRRALVAKLESSDPELYARYQAAQQSSDSLLDYCRTSDLYPLTGQGDINLYAVFAELAYQLVAPHGRVGVLTPSGIASDKTTKDFFAAIAATNRLIRLYDFENKKVFFPEVHASFKFCILNFGGSSVLHKAADFAFFIHTVEELEEKQRHIALSGDDIKLLNPNTRTCPIFRTRRDAEITKAIYRRVPILIDQNREGPTGNPWGIKFNTMFHQTNDAELFREAETLKADGFKLNGNTWIKRAGSSSTPTVFLPVYEAKMLQIFDHRAADVITDEANWVRQGQTAKTSLVAAQNPEHLATPRFWVATSDVESQSDSARTHFLAYKDVTSPTNQRTMIAAFTPFVAVVNSAPLVFTTQLPRIESCLLANLNSFAYDFAVRQKVSNVHLNFFIVEQAPTLPPDVYAKPCPWSPKTKLEKWVSERVLKLTCTAEDMLPLADACDFKSGSFQKEYGGRLNKWDEAERAQLMAELDAAYFHLYGIDRDDAEYILSTFKGIHDTTPLLPDRRSTAEHILAICDEFASGS